jgi:class 3 adenylate cyclase/nucleoside-triphosphatase THEP1
MPCAACGFENPAGFQFCGECGARLAPSAPPGARPWRDREPQAYTPRHLADRILTTRSALEGERKQVTVLFADVKGSLALAEKLDPEDWHRTLDRFFRILTGAVHRFEGTVNQYTGDGIMALFGAPIAHEDHARRACHAALEIARRLREFGDGFRRRHGLEFGVRMGMNSGEVVVGSIGDDLRMDYTAQGWVVGLASRAERLAAPGRIHLTEHTAGLVRGFFRLVPLGRHEVAGASGGLVLFELAGEAAPTRSARGESAGLGPFVGRSGALAGLEKALARALGGDGLAVGVEGEPGVGKSRLCLELASRCRARGLPVVEVLCPAHAGTLPHFAILELLRTLPDLLPSVEGADASRPSLEGDTEREWLALLAERAILARIGREPTILLFDDLHWIDPASEGFLGRLVAAVAGTPAFLLVNFRSEYRAPWMEHPSFHRIGLSPLDRRESLRLIRELLGRDPSARGLSERVYDRVGGNPLFIEESLRSLREAGRLAGGSAGAAWVDPGRDLEIPASVRAVLAARIDRLAEPHKRVLQAASVIGRRFERTVLARVLGLPEAELDVSLRSLEEAELVRPETPYRPADWSFKHPLTQEVACESLLVERRTEIHVAVARALEESSERLGARAELIAHHWEAADREREAALWRQRAAFRVTNLVPRRSARERSER